MDLIVQMRACGDARIAHQGDRISPLHILTLLNKRLLKMGVPRDNTISMPDSQQPAIPAMPFNACHDSIGRR
jgi:hypothetical protein